MPTLKLKPLASLEERPLSHRLSVRSASKRKQPSRRNSSQKQLSSEGFQQFSSRGSSRSSRAADPLHNKLLRPHYPMPHRLKEVGRLVCRADKPINWRLMQPVPNSLPLPDFESGGPLVFPRRDPLMANPWNRLNSTIKLHRIRKREK